ncbi:MAG: tRNA preQ1(34) S-adenosylmethionine ribosyltransferase-isomerase QueA [Pseudomonadota bacterium]
MRVDEFDFDLPQERIALEPANPRDSARMLFVRQAGVEDHTVRALPSLLRPGDLLVANDTKVIPAQLFGERAGRMEGGKAGPPVKIEATLHKDLGGDESARRWRAFLRPAKRVAKGDVIRFSECLSADVVARDGGEAQLSFKTDGRSFADALNQAGVMPLPPYIARRRPASDEDKEHYQTMFAAEAGSVAAPTAGLHFTPGLVASLGERGVRQMTITLHVGAGTFLPVTADDTADHKMHSEWGEITPEQVRQINDARAAGGRIIAVGTTSLRLLESAADNDGVIAPFAKETDIFITPGYRFKAVDMLMTNFHLPRSTLFMLVSAFSGTARMKAAYAHAVDREYRFYSYGDACLLERCHD